ncbi:Anks1b, partial [Symbiodinium pilosum]
IVRLLVENRASPESEATVDAKLHYYPIHDAVWFNQIKSVKMLLQKKAKVHAENNDKNTALHLAAMLGHDDMVEFLLYERTTFLKMKDGTSKKDGAKRENKLLVTSTNKEGKDALQLAVEKGQFSAFRLNLFTNAQLLDIESGDRAEAFLQVARNCPDAATALLRSEYPDSKHARNFADGIQLDVGNLAPELEVFDAEKYATFLRVKKLCELIEVAPQSAVDLLDMLTAKPKEGNKFHRPLPVRANIPVDQEACRLSCVYITEMEWTWNASETRPPAWQDQLAPPDPKKSQEVMVKVLLLPGVLNCEMVHCLAATKDQRIFTKLVIHALLKHLWQAFRPMFLIDLGHQILANAVICWWIWGSGQVESPKILRCALWGLLASEGVSECFTFVWTLAHGYKRLSLTLLLRWVKR